MHLIVYFEFAQNKQYHHVTEYKCNEKTKTINDILNFLFCKIQKGQWVFRVKNLKRDKQTINLNNFKQLTMQQFHNAFCEGPKITIQCVKKEYRNQYCSSTIKHMNDKIEECKEILKENIKNLSDWEQIKDGVKNKMKQCLHAIKNCPCHVCSYYNFIDPKRWNHIDIKKWYHEILYYHMKDQNERRIHMIHTLQNAYHNAELNYLKLYLTEWPTFFNKTCHYVYQGWYLLNSQSIKNYIQNFVKKLKMLKQEWTPANLSCLYKMFHFVIPASPKKDFVQSFWNYFLCLHGDWAPNLLKVSVAVQRRIDIYKNDFVQYCDEYGWNNDFDFVSYPFFLHVLYEIQTIYKIRFTDKRRFTICKTCSNILKASLNTNSLLEHEKIHMLKLAHLEEIKMLRHQILVYELESLHCPGKSAVLICDSMDQSCLNLPFDQRMSKANAGASIDSTCKFWLTCFISTLKPKYTFFLTNAQTG